MGSLFFVSATRRLAELTEARASGAEPEVLWQIRDRWNYATRILVQWHSRYVDGGSTQFATAEQLEEAVDLALRWQALETIEVGLRTGDLEIEREQGRSVVLANRRDAAVEVLDMLLERVTIPHFDVEDVPSMEPILAWFQARQGLPGTAKHVPTWVRGLAYARALSLLTQRSSTVSEDLDLGGLSFAEARRCYAVLVSKVEVAELCSAVLISANDIVCHMTASELETSLRRRVSSVAASAFMRLMTFADGRDPGSALIVPSGDFLALPGALISEIGFERALLRASAADPDRAGKLGNVLGRRADRWKAHLSQIPGVKVAERIKVKDASGADAGDLDLVLLAEEENVALVFETKWPIDAFTLREGEKVDDHFRKGIDQTRRVRGEIVDGAHVRWPKGWHVDPDVSIYWWVASATQLDSRGVGDSTVGTTSMRQVEHLARSCQGLRDLQAALSEPPLPREGIEFDLVRVDISAGRRTFRMPQLAIHGPMPSPSPQHRTSRVWT